MATQTETAAGGEVTVDMFWSSLIRSIFRPRRVLVIVISFCFVYALQVLRGFDELYPTQRRSGPITSSFTSLSSEGHTESAFDSKSYSAACIERFLMWYEDYCNAHLRPRYRPLNETNATLLCPCLPNTLVGFHPINETVPSMEELESDGGIEDLEENGRWRPSWCVARQRVAIIIPYADRERHLRIFLRHMHPFLQRQLIDYSIFVIEQLFPDLFNRAALMNVGFMEARKWTTTTTNDDDGINDDDDDDDDDDERPFDCFIFHDIDQLPIDDRNFYVCSGCPRHVVGFRKKFNYGYAYSTSFGGGNSFREEEFQQINGFSNTFYGWGGEDDDLYQRTVAANMSRMRFPRCIAKYDEVTHARDKRNPRGVNQQMGFTFRPDVYRKDGLTDLNYTVQTTKRTKLFTKISIHLPPPPPKESISGWLDFIRLLLGIQEKDP